MNKYVCLIILAGLGPTSNAQNFVYSTNQHISATMTDAFSSYSIYFKTVTPKAVTYKFEIVSNSLPEQWDFSLCDYPNCYIGIPVSGSMKAITLSEAQTGLEGFFSLTGTHMDVKSSGKLVIYVYDSTNYAGGDTVSWDLTYTGSASANTIASNASISVYPNPSNEYITIESSEVFTGGIYNGLGQQVISLNGDISETVVVSSLPSGIYHLKGFADSGHAFNSKLFIE